MRKRPRNWAGRIEGGWCASEVETANWTLSIRREGAIKEKISESSRLLRAGVSVNEGWKMVGFDSLRQFRYNFRERQSCTPGSLHQGPKTEERVRRAEQLLIEGRTCLADIASELGYGTRQGLVMAFYRVHGVSPTHWLADRRRR